MEEREFDKRKRSLRVRTGIRSGIPIAAGAGKLGDEARDSQPPPPSHSSSTKQSETSGSSA